jgi:FkbM family methyltransferase
MAALRRIAPQWVRRAVPRSAKRWLRSLLDAGAPPARPTATEDDVYFCYRLLLGREPDPDGWNTYVADARGGMTVEAMVSSFLSSPEFMSRNMHGSGDEPRLVELEGFRMYASPSDWAVGQTILRDRAYEPHVTRAVRSVLRPGMVFVDVGANIGYFSLLSAAAVGPTGRVFAFEPSPRNCAMLHFSAAANGFRNIEIHPFAVFESAQLLVYDTQGSNGIVSDLTDDARILAYREVARACTLDGVLGVAGRVDAIKLDIEGAEYCALRGAQGVLRRHRPVLFTEFSPGGLRNVSKVSGTEYLQLLIDAGYALWVLRDDGQPIECSTDVDRVLRLCEARRASHIDLLARPRGG